MAAIEELIIQGIRSFSPDQENKIKFRSPITIISGQNGAGKTTIIECLRFMATGEQPPKSAGGAFVTDPRLTGTSEVKARVILQFRNCKGETICATKLLMSTLKGSGQINLKSLDFNFSLIVAGKRQASTSSRCIDHEREMLRQLGVSKSVLSSVIFCHQEESNWPLAESNEVKTKFDNIFEINRFTKALDNFKKLKTKYQSHKKLVANELTHMGERKKQVDDFKFQKASKEKAYAEKEAEMIDLGELIQSKENELECEGQMLERARQREMEFQTKQNNLKNVEQNISSYAGKFSLINPNQDVGELRRMREGHAGRVQEEEKHHESREKEMKDIERDQSAAESELKECEERLWSLKEKKKGAEKLRSGLKDLMDELSFQLSANSSPLLSSPGGLQRDTLSRGKSHLHLVECEIKSLASEQEAEESALVSRKEDLVREQAKQEQTCKLREEERKETKDNLTRIREELGSCAELEDIQERIDLANDELTSLKESRDVGQIESDIEQLLVRKQEQERRIPPLERESAELDRETFTRKTINNYDKEKQQKQRSIKEILDRINPELESLFDWIPPQSELEGKLGKLKIEKEDERKSLSSKLNTLNKELSDSCARKKMCEQQIVELKESLDRFKSSLKEMCGEEDYTHVVESLKQEHHSEQDKLMTSSSSKSFYKECQNYINQRHSCPVCKREFQESETMKKTLESLDKRMNLIVPKLMSQQENQLSYIATKLERLQHLSGTREEMIKVEKETIPNLQSEDEQLIIDESQLSQEISQLESKLENSQDRLERISSLIPDVRVLREKERECTEIDSKISSESGKLKNPIASKSAEEVKSQLQKAQRQVKLLDSQIEDKQTAKLTHQKQVQSKEQEINKLNATQLEQQKRRQKQTALLDKRVELEKKLKSLDVSIKEVIRSISPIKASILKLESELKDKHRQDERILNVKRQQFEQFKSLIEKINQKQKEVDMIASETSETNHDACLTEVRLAKDRVNGLSSKYEELRSDIRKFSNEISNSRSINREFNDAIALKDHQEKFKRLKQEVEELKIEIGTKQTSKIEASISQINALLKTKSSKRDKLSGELKQMRNTIGGLERTLNSDSYRDIEKDFEVKKFEQRVVETMIKDFDYSYKTLDRCMMQFHRSKIDQINATLQELWPSIYRGPDIDYIQIAADDDGKTSATGRSAYNYRVVMVKGDIELDMRGRCSAGQKVLACILIRLALAETFSGKCGIIALDEPTTNLDQKNMLSLADALVSLLERKAHSGSNIQMVLITHEQQFVEAFEHSELVEYYWDLKKSDNFSRISKLPLSSGAP